MDAAALALALAGALLHAIWNLLLARADDSEAAAAVALVCAVVAFAPLTALTWTIDGEALPFLAASTAFVLTYYALLGRAYRTSELSVVYPIARGTAPLLVLGIGTLALDQRLGTAQALGVAVVALGIVLVRGLRRPASRRDVWFAVAIAACIGGFTLSDAKGVEHAGAVTFLALILAPTAGAYLAAVAAFKGLAPVRRAVTPANVTAGLATFGAGALTLAALERAPAAPVAAVRETSVVIATALAAVVLREAVTPARLAGAAAVLAGVALLALP